MLSFSKVFLLALSATSVLGSAATVLAALKNPVDPDVTNINTLTSAYPGSSPSQQLLTIQNAVSKLTKDIDAVTSDANSSAAPTSSEAQSILDYLNGQLLTDTKTTIATTKSKRANFDTYGARSTVKGQLQKVQTSLDNLANALIAKAPTSALKTSGQNSKTTYDNLLNDAITYFS